MDRGVLEEELQTEEEAGTRPDGREQRYSILRQSRSLFAPLPLMAARWRKMHKSAEEEGEELQLRYIAELRVGPNEGFYAERIGKGGHMSIWGDTSKLAASVLRVVSGERMIEEAEDGV
jgi:hypothetical protein